MKPLPAGYVLLTVALATGGSLPDAVVAQGHGPLYGLSTPTLGRGGWSLDVAGMTRRFEEGHSFMLRPMLGFGVTEDVQLSFSAPVPVVRSENAPVVRGLTRMPVVQDVELMLGWRFQREGVGVGARRETTLWVAVDVPLEGRRGGLDTAPALFVSGVTGYASRSFYLWVGAAHRWSPAVGSANHRLGSSSMATLVVGYRPERFRGDYPSPDWRGFIEVVAERVGSASVDRVDVTDSGGRQLYVAPTLLGLYGSWGIAGGPAFPLYQSLHGEQPDDGIRLALNVSLWF